MHVCFSLRVRTDGPNNGSQTAQVAQMRGEKASQWTARSEHIRPHSRADCPTILTRCDTCATPGCAARTVYASGRLPRGCALLVARLAAPHSENAPQISVPYPIVEQIRPVDARERSEAGQTRARRAREAVLIMGICDSPGRVLDSKCTVHLLPGHSNARLTCPGKW